MQLRFQVAAVEISKMQHLNSHWRPRHLRDLMSRHQSYQVLSLEKRQVSTVPKSPVAPQKDSISFLKSYQANPSITINKMYSSISVTPRAGNWTSGLQSGPRSLVWPHTVIELYRRWVKNHYHQNNKKGETVSGCEKIWHFYTWCMEPIFYKLSSQWSTKAKAAMELLYHFLCGCPLQNELFMAQYSALIH